jgi:hypothetical protein
MPDPVQDVGTRRRSFRRSLQKRLRLPLIELARQPDPATLVARIRARKAATGKGLSADQILGFRDADRRCRFEIPPGG